MDTLLSDGRIFPPCSLSHVYSIAYEVGLGIFSLEKPWYRGCCIAVFFSSADRRGASSMVEAGSVLGKRNADGCPLERFVPLMPVGLPLDYAHPESSRRHALPPSGLRPAIRQRRGPPT
jgi:hypothetical protein